MGHIFSGLVEVDAVAVVARVVLLDDFVDDV